MTYKWTKDNMDKTPQQAFLSLTPGQKEHIVRYWTNNGSVSVTTLQRMFQITYREAALLKRYYETQCADW